MIESMGLDINSIKDRLRSRLQKEEGEVLHPYPDQFGIKTIGIGHNMEANPLPDYIEHYLAQHGEITEEMSEYLFDQDLCSVMTAVKPCFSDSAWSWMDVNVRGVIINMSFNMGIGIFVEGSTAFWPHFHAAVEAHDYQGMIDSMENSRWHKQLPGRSQELMDIIKTAMETTE